MNCHNAEEFLKEALESVINQKYSNWELIFWDNNSTDKSKTILDTYQDSRIKYFFSKKFTSLGEARNLAIRESRGEYIAFLDCDDLWTHDKLNLQIPLFNDPEVGIVISNTIFFNQKGIKKKLFSRYRPPTGYVFKHLLESYFIVIETAVIRKSALDQIDWFDEKFEVIEEFDVFTRLAIKFKLDYVDQTLGKHRIHKNNLSQEKKYLFPIEKKYFINKLNKESPEVKLIYKQSIEKFCFQIKIDEFLIDWERNNKPNRKIIKSIIKNSKKALFIYIFSIFFNYNFFNYFKKKKNLNH